MKQLTLITGLAGLLCLGGCTTVGGALSPSLSPAGLPKTPGEIASNYGYVPLDPLAIYVDKAEDGSRCESLPLLEVLPDIAVRFAVAEVDASGGLNFGPSKTTVQGHTYRAVLDYVNVDAIPIDFMVRKQIADAVMDPKWTKVSAPVPLGYKVSGYEAHYLARSGSEIDPASLPRIKIGEADSYERVTIPVYVGIGLRLSADIRANKGDITLSGLGAIGAQAEAKNLSGTMTVQTLGVTGKSIAVALPLPSKLDQTTIESGILAIGGSRAILYTAASSTQASDKVTAQPRIVGLYSPIGSDPRLINAVYSELSRAKPYWEHPCKVKDLPRLATGSPSESTSSPPAAAAPAAKLPARASNKSKGATKTTAKQKT